MSSFLVMIDAVLDTGALSIWNRDAGPVFWYAAGVPGPFYLNTEHMIGRDLATELLASITTIIAHHPEPKARAEEVEHIIMDAYARHPIYQNLIDALSQNLASNFLCGSYDLISGGERRDWLFSIPLARKLGVPHLYLFKNGTLYSDASIAVNAGALHVADLINNAASYFDAWLPILAKNKLVCRGTFSVVARGEVGVRRLTEAGYKTVPANTIDLDFFKTCLAHQKIDRATFDEISLFFCSPKEWAGRYLMGRPELFATVNLDSKSRERLSSFFIQDPWGLRTTHEAFFAEMLEKIATQ